MDIVDVEEKKTFKTWFNEKRVLGKEKAIIARDWCLEHKETVIAIMTIAVPAVVDLTKTAIKRKNCSDQKELKDKYIYDRSRGHYYELKRKPTSRQWQLIDDRRDQGERLSDILDDLHLLK